MAVVLALVVAAVVHYLPRSAHPAGRAAAPSTTGAPSSTAAPSLGASPVPTSISGAVSGDGAVAAEPDGITGQVQPWPGGLRLLAAGQQPGWFAPVSGQVVPVGGLPSQRSGYEFTRAADGWAVQADPAGPAACRSCAGPRRSVYFLPDAGRSAATVGQADSVAPGTAGTLWLTSYPDGADPRTAEGAAREISTTGRPLGAPVSLPAGYLIVRGTAGGLLLAPVARQPGTNADMLWDRSARRFTRTFDQVLAASPTQIAWTPPCVARCQVQILDLDTGRQIPVELPAASWVASAAFSPDGRFLALQESFSDSGNDGQLAVQLELVSTATGGLTVIPQTWVSSDALAGFGWPAGGDTLVAELIFTRKVQLASWHPGDKHLAIAALAPRDSPVSLVIGQFSL